MDIWRQQCDSPCVAATVDFICRYALYHHGNAILSDAHHKACVGCGADGVCGAGHDAFHGIYTFFHGGADYAECFHRQPVEPDSGKELNLPSAVKAIEMSRPWQSMLWVLALMLLYTLVMVLVMLLFNIWKGQIAGIAAVISFSCYGLLLNPDNIKKVLHLPDQLSYKARVLVGWISPLNQATFYMHNFGYDKLPTLGQTVAIGFALLAVLLILTICAIRRYAFSFSGTEGK